jgi:predicted DNA-binding protein
MAVKEETQQFTIRLPREEYEALKAISVATGTSLNELFHTAIQSYLADGGRREHIAALMTQTIEQYQIALDKLKDM